MSYSTLARLCILKERGCLFPDVGMKRVGERPNRSANRAIWRTVKSRLPDYLGNDTLATDLPKVGLG